MNKQTNPVIDLPIRRQTLRPVGQWHLCSTNKTTAGGIIIPDSADGDGEFLIIASGPGLTDQVGNPVPMRGCIGDVVAFGPGVRMVSHPRFKDLVLLEDEFICCVVEGK